MPKLSCRSCGRQIYTVAPLEALFAEERRCPRCGAFLHEDRRAAERRVTHRRINPSHDPGPPKSKPKPKAKAKTNAKTNAKLKPASDPSPSADLASMPGDDEASTAEEGERRRADRRSKRRRGGGTAKPPTNSTDSGGWRD